MNKQPMIVTNPLNTGLFDCIVQSPQPRKKQTPYRCLFFRYYGQFELTTDGFPEHNIRALPAAEKAKDVMAQRSKNCHAPSEQLFGHRKSASKGKAFARNKFESCPRNH